MYWYILAAIVFLVLAVLLYKFSNVYDPVTEEYYGYKWRKIWVPIFTDIPLEESMAQAQVRYYKMIEAGFLEGQLEDSRTCAFHEIPCNTNEAQIKAMMNRDQEGGKYVKELDDWDAGHLLAERVVDLVLFFYENSLIPGNEIPTIGYAPKRDKIENQLNYYVMIRTRHTDWYKLNLSEYRKWLPINILLDDVSHVDPKYLRAVYH